ncbi:MAG: hypothetical protein A2270_03880 [Elusimicrobia bacterium RIFOXYA12_FULL_51_18]|nr:MAG: hypothetical protein A2270_03880 [Elusimicrobia bacterium RIFOXYA12_FULL_51_18]OGS29890.1 MAG: hypothetical protein A2218_02580 [Elusimicrobia bacterium RIFOXYA2_FULL_53_38]
MNGIIKYLKLYGIAGSNNLKSLLVYKLDFFIGLAAMFLNNAMRFLILVFIFNMVDKIKGWSFDQMLFFYGFSTMVTGLWHCFFINVISLPYYIRTGEFDRFLLRPVNLLFQITIDSLDEDGWGELLLGIALVIFACVRLGLPLWKLILLAPMAISGCAILIAISLLLSAVSFISIGGVPVMELMLKMFEFTKYPVNIFSQGLKIILSCVIPLGFVTFYPSMVFLGSNTLIYLTLVPLVSAAYFLVAYFVWNYSIKFYVSSGN